MQTSKIMYLDKNSIFTKKLYTLLISCIIIQVYAQKNKELDSTKLKDIQKYFSPIVSTSYNKEDSIQFEPIRKAIGNKRIVMLGEHFHSDGTTIFTKEEIVKYLHEKMGFNVLLREYPYIMMNRVSNFSKTETEFLISYTASQMGAISPHSVDFLKYIYASNKTNNPLYIEGIDIGSNTTLRSNINYMDSIFSLNIELKNAWTRPRNAYVSYFKFKNSYIDKNSFKKDIDILIPLLDKQEFPYKLREHLKLLIHNLYYEIDCKLFNPKYPNYIFSDSYNLRDYYMAENVKQLASIYNNEKIIIWAASYHTARDLKENVCYPKRLIKSHTMGEYLYQKYPEDIYSIAFICHDGISGNKSVGFKAFGYSIDKKRIELTNDNAYFEFEIPKPESGSIENLIYQSNHEYGFLNISVMKQDSIEWINKPINMYQLLFKSMNAYWVKIYDGLFYIKTMHPNYKIDMDYKYLNITVEEEKMIWDNFIGLKQLELLK